MCSCLMTFADRYNAGATFMGGVLLALTTLRWVPLSMKKSEKISRFFLFWFFFFAFLLFNVLCSTEDLSCSSSNTKASSSFFSSSQFEVRILRNMISGSWGERKRVVFWRYFARKPLGKFFVRFRGFSRWFLLLSYFCHDSIVSCEGTLDSKQFHHLVDVFKWHLGLGVANHIAAKTSYCELPLSLSARAYKLSIFFDICLNMW